MVNGGNPGRKSANGVYRIPWHSRFVINIVSHSYALGESLTSGGIKPFEDLVVKPSGLVEPVDMVEHAFRAVVGTVGMKRNGVEGFREQNESTKLDVMGYSMNFRDAGNGHICMGETHHVASKGLVTNCGSFLGSGFVGLLRVSFLLPIH